MRIDDKSDLLFNESEEMWQKYIEDLAMCGITSVRAGSLGGEAWDENSLQVFTDTYPGLRIENIPWENKYKRSMNLARFRVTDERLKWILDNYPDIYIQLILFGLKTWGADDTGPLWKAIPEEVEWYCPTNGNSIMDKVKGGRSVGLTAPWKGKDAVLYLKKKGKQETDIKSTASETQK